MIRRTVARLAFTSLLCITPAAAQQADTLTTSLRPGARSLSFGALGGGGGSFQYWRMRSERTNLGVMVTLGGSYRHGERKAPDREDEYDVGSAAISVGPVLRHYTTTTSRVNPFLYGSALVGYQVHSHRHSELPDTYSQHGLTGTLASGLGAEWFPVRSISFSGQTGLEFGTRYAFGEVTSQYSSEDFEVFASTFTSSLSISLYWPRRTR